MAENRTTIALLAAVLALSACTSDHPTEGIQKFDGRANQENQCFPANFDVPQCTRVRNAIANLRNSPIAWCNEKGWIAQSYLDAGKMNYRDNGPLSSRLGAYNPGDDLIWLEETFTYSDTDGNNGPLYTITHEVLHTPLGGQMAGDPAAEEEARQASYTCSNGTA